MTKEEMILKKSMSKKAYKALKRKMRQVSNMNTGTRIHKNAKDYNRRANKQMIKEMGY